MKRFALASAVTAFLAITLLLVRMGQGDPQQDLPLDYESWSACQKQDYLWDERILPSEHQELPPYRDLGIRQIKKMIQLGIEKKLRVQSDAAPKGWEKMLHAVGSVAKVEWVPVSNDLGYTGIFEGAYCGLVRLSLTYTPEKRGVAPGMALKFFRDGEPSVNVSALTSIDPQGQNYNFFKNPMSNMVPPGSSLGAKLIHSIFLMYTPYPEKLLVSEFSERDEYGVENPEPKSPEQIFFVPQVVFPETPNDVREGFAELSPGTLLYEVRVPLESERVNYKEYSHDDRKRLVSTSVHIGNLFLKSRFVASEFGDSQLYFRHQAYEQNGYAKWIRSRVR